MDRNGTKIATSERIYNVILDMKVMLSKEEYIEPTIQVLEDCFGIAEEDVRTLMDKNPTGRYNICLLYTSIVERRKRDAELSISDTGYNVPDEKCLKRILYGAADRCV